MRRTSQQVEGLQDGIARLTADHARMMRSKGAVRRARLVTAPDDEFSHPTTLDARPSFARGSECQCLEQRISGIEETVEGGL